MSTFLHFPYSSLLAHFGLWKRQPGHAWHVNSGCWAGPPGGGCCGGLAGESLGPSALVFHSREASSGGRPGGVGPAPMGRVLLDTSLPSGCPELPGGGKRHFARWVGSLPLPVAGTTMSAQQTHGCLFPDVVPGPRRRLINVCSVTDQVQVHGLSWTRSSY